MWIKLFYDILKQQIWLKTGLKFWFNLSQLKLQNKAYIVKIKCNFTFKISPNLGYFFQINHPRLEKVAQWAKFRPIWSPCDWLIFDHSKCWYS